MLNDLFGETLENLFPVNHAIQIRKVWFMTVKPAVKIWNIILILWTNNYVFILEFSLFLALFLLFCRKTRLIKWSSVFVCRCKILPLPNNFQTSYSIDTKFWLYTECPKTPTMLSMLCRTANWSLFKKEPLSGNARFGCCRASMFEKEQVSQFVPLHFGVLIQPIWNP